MHLIRHLMLDRGAFLQYVSSIVRWQTGPVVTAQWSGFVYKELIPKGGGSGGVPQGGRLFKFDFPSAKFWVNFFLGWVDGSQRQKTPSPSDKQSLIVVVGDVPLHGPCVGTCVWPAHWHLPVPFCATERYPWPSRPLTSQIAFRSLP